VSLIFAYTQKCWYERLGGDNQFFNQELAIGKAEKSPSAEGKHPASNQGIFYFSRFF
jgi:hypothetical protein